MKKRRNKFYLIGLPGNCPAEIVPAPSESIAIKKYRKYSRDYESIPLKVRELTPFEIWLFRDELKEVRLSSEPVIIPEYDCFEIPPDYREEISGKSRVLDFYLEERGDR